MRTLDLLVLAAAAVSIGFSLLTLAPRQKEQERSWAKTECRNPEDATVTFRLDDFDYLKLKQLAKIRKVSVGKLVRQAVLKRRERLTAEREANR